MSKSFEMNGGVEGISEGFVRSPMSSRTSDLYEFGPYRLDPQRRVFTREDRVVPLAPKTFELLLLLLQGDGRAFSKQELMTALWPDTFVEEANLSFQISVLRKALGEADSHWIETVPKHGYRLTADVKVIPRGGDQTSAVLTAEMGGPPPSTTIDRATNRKSWMAALAAGVAGVVFAAGWYAAFRRDRPTVAVRPPQAAAVPITAYPGFENAPSLSPDGSQVAFSWNGRTQDNYDIYVKLAGPGEAIQLTTDPRQDDNPARSPDGRHIAFERFTAMDKVEVFVIPALGGAERKVATDLRGVSQAGTTFGSTGHLSWTPDGRWLARGFSREGGIWLIAADGSDRRRLTHEIDAGPAFSEDGRYVAFIRSSGAGFAVYVLPLTSGMMPAGPPSRVTPEAPWIRGLAWTPDGLGLVFSSGGHLGSPRLHRIALASNRLGPVGVPELLAFGENGTAVSISRTGRLVYSARFSDANIWRLSLTGPDRPGAEPLVRSTLNDWTPDYSPNGTRLAFASTQSGTEEIWVANADGTDPKQVTSIGGPMCANPRWSLDGQKILFHSRRDGSADLYILHLDSGKVDRLTENAAQDVEPRWSRDGRTIYFGSNRTGQREVWKMSAAGGAAVRITTQGGMTATESPDSRFLYYAKKTGSPTAIWRVPVDGGEETPIVEGLSNSLNFVVAKRGLYFVAVGDAPHKTSIDFFEFETGKQTTLLNLGKQWSVGMALSPDEKSLLYSVVDSAGSNLMLVDKFQ